MYLRVMKAMPLLFLSLFTSLLQAQDTLPLPLLGIDIKVLHYGQRNASVLMYNMHDNENTSAFAGRAMSLKYGGEYIEITHTGKRMFSFAYGADSVHVDPNRIYTDAGIWAQLEKNKVRDTLIFQAIAVWRDSMLRILQLDQRELIIALHNNTNNRYSFKSYMPGESDENEAAQLVFGRYADMDDFFFVTDPLILNQLAAGSYYIVLQNNDTMTDDGSLSVYCAQQGIRYINVETQHRHLFRQIQMLIFAFQTLVTKE